MQRTRWFTTAAATVGVTVSLVGCYSWKVVEPTTIAAEPPPARIRLTTASRSRLELLDPAISGDTVVGRNTDTTVAIHLDDVTSIEKRTFSLSNTLGLVFLGTGSAILLAGTLAVIGCAFAGGCGM